MSLFVILGALAVLCLTALVAAGRGGALAPAEPDRTPTGELPDGEITAESVRFLRFSLAFRGYRMSEVDAVLKRLADELNSRDEPCGAASQMSGSAPEDEHPRQPDPTVSEEN